MKRHALSFKHAFNGLLFAFRTQPNYKIHFLLSFAALIGASFFRISYFEFLIIVLFIFLGLAIEMVNTAVEATCDAIDKNHREDIKIAKDISAAAMLLFSIGAFVVACIIFIPKIISYFGY